MKRCGEKTPGRTTQRGVFTTNTMKKILISFLFFSLIGLTAGEDLQKLPLPELEQQAEAGGAEAQTELARRYAYGEGVPQEL